MSTKIIQSAAFVVAAALTGVPVISHAATAQATHVNYETSLSSIYGLPSPWTGTLQLTINPSGIIQGYYRPADNAAFIPVTGGQNGDQVWLDIGSSGRLHVNGVLKNGVITGGAIDERTKEAYNFSARVSD
jgi:hypothetical protein